MRMPEAIVVVKDADWWVGRTLLWLFAIRGFLDTVTSLGV